MKNKQTLFLGFCLSIILIHHAHAHILWQKPEFFTAEAIAATYNITGGDVPTATSTQSVIYFYSDSACNSLLNNTIVLGNYTFHTNTSVSASGTTMYNIANDLGLTPSSIHSLKIDPGVFTTLGCFSVTASGNTLISTTTATTSLSGP